MLRCRTALSTCWLAAARLIGERLLMTSHSPRRAGRSTPDPPHQLLCQPVDTPQPKTLPESLDGYHL